MDDKSLLGASSSIICITFIGSGLTIFNNKTMGATLGTVFACIIVGYIFYAFYDLIVGKCEKKSECAAFNIYEMYKTISVTLAMSTIFLIIFSIMKTSMDTVN